MMSVYASCFGSRQASRINGFFCMKTQITKHSTENINRQLFLLSFFDKKEGYEEKEANGYWLIKQFNRRQEKWQVAIYSKVAYLKRKTHEARVKDLVEARRNNASEDK